MAMHDDALAEWLTFVLLGEIGITFLDGIVAVNSDSVCGTMIRGLDGDRFTVLR
jgi:hypothetical protein